MRAKRMNTFSSNTKSKTRLCPNCAKMESKKEIPGNEGRQSEIEELKDFSEKMSSIKFPSAF